MSVSFTVAVIGLGEAGSTIAHDLVRAGVQVRGWDPAPRGNVSLLPLAESGQVAAEQADVILSINVASVALVVAHDLHVEPRISQAASGWLQELAKSSLHDQQE